MAPYGSLLQHARRRITGAEQVRRTRGSAERGAQLSVLWRFCEDARVRAPLFPRGALARPEGAAAAGPQARAHATATAGLSRERIFGGPRRTARRRPGTLWKQ